MKTHADTNSVENSNNLEESTRIPLSLKGDALNLSLYPFPEEPVELNKRVPIRLPNTFGTAEPTTSISATGVNNIDGVLHGRKWQSTNITYGFTDDFANDYETSYYRGRDGDYDYESGFEALNATQKDVAQYWYSMYENVSDLNMTELTGESDRDATLRLAESNVSNPTAFAFLPGNYVEAGDSWYSPDIYNNPQIGNYAFSSFGHEFGHAFGLKHGHEMDGVSDVAMDSDRDSSEFSIMTYRSYIGHDKDAVPGRTNEAWGFPQTPMMYDIAAIQEMYGADFDTNSGDTEYTFSTTTGEMFVDGVGEGTPGGNRIFRTLWDGNGIDTYNLDNYTTDLSVSLEPGSWSDFDVNGNNQRAKLSQGQGGIVEYSRAHVFNAVQYNSDVRSLIENAVGGSGDDLIDGNIADNSLEGGLGADAIAGKSGDDNLLGGDGDDTIDGGLGNDNLDGGLDNDVLLGGDNSDTLVGNAGQDSLNGGSQNDNLSGNEGMDTLRGAGGNDVLDGGSDNDLLTGGNGKDTLIGTSGRDIIKGQGGVDVLDGGADIDILVGGGGRDIFVLSTDLNNKDRDIVRDFDLGTDLLGVSSMSEVNSLDVMNNSSDTASIITHGNGKQVAVLQGITEITMNDLNFVVI